MSPGSLPRAPVVAGHTDIVGSWDVHPRSDAPREGS